MRILSTRSKISSKGFYESFIFNKQCSLYIYDRYPAAWVDTLLIEFIPIFDMDILCGIDTLIDKWCPSLKLISAYKVFILQ